VRTPALDYLAARGVSFSDSYCADPVCSPSRASIFTGRMPSECDVSSNGRHILPSIPNLGQWFSENSKYETVYAGKWHLPRSYQQDIAGFTVLPGGLGGQGNVGDTCVSRACEAYIRNRASSRPFLLAACFMQPHDICEWLRMNMNDPGELRYPEIASELPALPRNFDYEAIEPRAVQRRRNGNEPVRGGWTEQHWQYYLWSYYWHIEMVDGEAGRILEALEGTGQMDNTAILFTSDHGEGMAHHQMVRKSSPYDEAAKVPFLLSWPGELPADREEKSTLVNGVDIMPTLCDLAAIKSPPGMCGRSVRAAVSGKEDNAPGYIVTEVPANIGRVLRTSRYKFTTFANDTVEQLFDMTADPGETTNLAAGSRHAAALQEHKALLREWESRREPAPNQPNANAWWRRPS
jgi:arylsulfatase A-like enzyme